jgi:isopentenyl-diphosphate delta-isomerase
MCVAMYTRYFGDLLECRGMQLQKHVHTADRKADHIRINLTRDVSGKGIQTGLDAYRFAHCALPEIDLDDVDIQGELLSHRLAVPLMISSMTGGTEESARINQTLARAAQAHGLAMGIGSGRALLEDYKTLPSFNIRYLAPDVPLFANLGAVQLNYGYTSQQCLELVERTESNGLILHLNPLQEAVQPEGNTRFMGLLKRIADVCTALPVPVIVKEVGWGLSAQVVEKLHDAGVAAVDVAGAGGTSWSEVEKYRGDDVQRLVAQAFADWGIPTAEALIDARRAVPNQTIIASGGIRDGVDAAKCVALGADIVGIARPLLKAAVESAEELDVFIETFKKQLKITMFCVGAQRLTDLRQPGKLIHRP